ncbi:ImmA/IrrE family metallo-endopeptidase [Fluviibacter sp.]
METIKLSPSVLDWAAAQAGRSLADLAQSLSKRGAQKILEGALTYAQAVRFAKRVGVSLGDLFLDEPPPPRALPLVDFRTPWRASPLSRDFFATYDDVAFKQAWYREYKHAQGYEPLSFIGKCKNQKPTVEEMAKEIRGTLNFSEADLHALRNADELFTCLAKKCEDLGILVLKNDVVGNNNKRPLSVSEFRGFALADEFAPVVFINGADASAAWVFTLANELVHLWLGDSGVSDVDPEANNAIERYCNAVAAELLVPQQQFEARWLEFQHLDLQERINAVRKAFKVSGLVIARTAFELGYIDAELLHLVYDAARIKKGSGTGGGDFYRTLTTRNSKRFSTEISELAVSGGITLGYAGRLLNTNPNNIVKLYAKQHALPI